MMAKSSCSAGAMTPSLSLPRYRKPGVPGLRIDAEVGNSRLRMGEGTLTIGVSKIPTKRGICSLSREAGEGWGGG
ncbi:hypothetical protein D1O30_08880 [Methylocystis hirsuta]|uniref:Uncharacterized protein n=1 Tax=Methylocystis hirsuta TaxID=369798 RepID=A0A3M9XRG7_9HYPH|nr:hypothetical protein D1O30_08880 [Methylocystis hirsuta]